MKIVHLAQLGGTGLVDICCKLLYMTPPAQDASLRSILSVKHIPFLVDAQSANLACHDLSPEFVPPSRALWHTSGQERTIPDNWPLDTYPPHLVLLANRPGWRELGKPIHRKSLI